MTDKVTVQLPLTKTQLSHTRLRHAGYDLKDRVRRSFFQHDTLGWEGSPLGRSLGKAGRVEVSDDEKMLVISRPSDGEAPQVRQRVRLVEWINAHAAQGYPGAFLIQFFTILDRVKEARQQGFLLGLKKFGVILDFDPETENVVPALSFDGPESAVLLPGYAVTKVTDDEDLSEPEFRKTILWDVYQQASLLRSLQTFVTYESARTKKEPEYFGDHAGFLDYLSKNTPKETEALFVYRLWDHTTKPAYMVEHVAPWNVFKCENYRWSEPMVILFAAITGQPMVQEDYFGKPYVTLNTKGSDLQQDIIFPEALTRWTRFLSGQPKLETAVSGLVLTPEFSMCLHLDMAKTSFRPYVPAGDYQKDQREDPSELDGFYGLKPELFFSDKMVMAMQEYQVMYHEPTLGRPILAWNQRLNYPPLQSLDPLTLPSGQIRREETKRE